MTLVLAGPGRTLAIAPPLLLAPMAGATDPEFRRRVAALGGLGAAVTEFVRITVAPVPQRVCRRALGEAPPVPTALQFMMAETRFLAASIANAERAGAAWIDLNFGCPAPIVFRKCAGSALLAHPERLAAFVRCAAQATPLPVTAKLRAGIDSAAHLGELVCAAAEAGAAAVTVHARLRRDPYAAPATWAWLAEAKQALARCARPVPLIGNGGVQTAADVARLRAATGADAVMVGQAALADPFLFRVAAGGDAPTVAEAARWALDYLDAIGWGPKAKQLLRHWRAAGMLADRSERCRLLAASVPEIRAWFAARSGNERPREELPGPPCAAR